MRNRHRAVIRPLVTEKTSTAFQDRQEYVFVCDIDANKFEIKDAIESMFPVHEHIRSCHKVGIRELSANSSKAAKEVS